MFYPESAQSDSAKRIWRLMKEPRPCPRLKAFLNKYDIHIPVSDSALAMWEAQLKSLHSTYAIIHKNDIKMAKICKKLGCNIISKKVY